MAILTAETPVRRLLANPETDPKLKNQLNTVQRIREFAKARMKLPIDDHYTEYVALDRPYAMWTIFAAPEYSLAPKKWCFPIAGCVSYRGYFKKKPADEAADRLRNEGYEIYLSGAVAYSTLGWFEDPVLSTFVFFSEAGLAGIIFHELAHQELYVKGDTFFNESFAVAVEREGVRRWFVDKKDMAAFAAYEIKRNRRQGFVALIERYREKLENLYEKDLPVKEMHRRKLQIFDALRNDYARLKNKWGGYAGYDAFMGRDLNNAHLISIGAYHKYEQAFRILLEKMDGDIASFYEACKKVASLPEKKRHRYLQELMDAS